MEIPDEYLNEEQFAELRELCKTKNNLTFNVAKCIEEMAELNELLIKLITKPADQQIDKSKLIEEGGDLMFRFAIMMDHLEIMEEVMQRANNKEAFIYKHLKEKGGTKITVERG